MSGRLEREESEEGERGRRERSGNEAALENEAAQCHTGLPARARDLRLKMRKP